jgi:hypothetical protein
MDCFLLLHEVPLKFACTPNWALVECGERRGRGSSSCGVALRLSPPSMPIHLNELNWGISEAQVGEWRS